MANPVLVSQSVTARGARGSDVRYNVMRQDTFPHY